MKTKTQKEQISALTTKMIELQSWRDWEGGHSEADKLLCDALKIFGCHDLIDQYEKVNKWYA